MHIAEAPDDPLYWNDSTDNTAWWLEARDKEAWGDKGLCLQCNVGGTTSNLPSLGEPGPAATGKDTLKLVEQVFEVQMRLRQRPGKLPILSVLGPPSRAEAAKDRVKMMIETTTFNATACLASAGASESAAACPAAPGLDIGGRARKQLPKYQGDVCIASFGVEKMSRRLPREPEYVELLSVVLEEDIANVESFVDVRNFPDPEAAVMGLTKHNGHHPDIIAGIVRHPEFYATLELVKRAWLEVLDRVIDRVDGSHAPIYVKAPLTIAFYCKSGRHRSVAWACIMYYIFNRGLTEGKVDLVHVSMQRGHWKHLCKPGCEHCDKESEVRDRALLLAWVMWESL